MKRITSFILTVVICLSVFSGLFAAAADNVSLPTPPVYYGVQRQTTGTNTQNLRFVSLVNTLVGDSVGYEISVKYGSNTSVYTYDETKSNKVFSSIIAGGDTYTASSLGAEAALMTAVIQNVPTNIGVIEFTVTPCVEYDGNVIRGESWAVTLNGDKIEEADGEVLQVSVMSFNVLNAWTGVSTVEAESALDRARATLSMAYDADLDFVCFQEFDINYRFFIDGEVFGTTFESYFSEISSFKAKYAELSLVGKTADSQGVKTINDQSRIWNPIYYDKTKYEVVDCGVYDFVDWGLESYESSSYVHEDADNNTSDSRSLVWGVFEHKTTGERFIVANTHLSPTVSGSPATLSDWAEVRRTEAEFIAQRIDALYGKYGCAAIICGDYNSNIGGKGCMNVLSAGYVDTWDMAEEKTDSNGYHNNCINRTNYSDFSDAPTGAYSAAIDHILSKTSLDVVSYDIITDKIFTGYDMVSSVLDLSDHCPVVMTFTVPVEISGNGRLDVVIGNAEDVTAEWVE